MPKRSYAAVPHDYLEEMELLSDAEFGRLIRALLVYSRTGETSELGGNERVLFPRVKLQEDRFQESYNTSIEQKREAGRKGAEARKNKKRRSTDEYDDNSANTPNNDVEQEASPLSDAKQKQAPLSTAKQRLTEASETSNNKNNNKTIPLDANASKGSIKRQSRFSAPTREEVAAFCQERGSSVDPDHFVDYYTAQGWRLSNNVPMKDWKAAVRNWERRDCGKQTGNSRRRNTTSPTEDFLRIAEEEGCL